MAMHTLDVGALTPDTDIMKLILEQIKADYKFADNFMPDSLINVELQTSNEDDEFELIITPERGVDTHVWIKNGVFKSAYNPLHPSRYRISGIKNVDALDNLRIYYVF